MCGRTIKEIIVKHSGENNTPPKYMDVVVKNLDMMNDEEVEGLISQIKDLVKQAKKLNGTDKSATE